MRDPLFWRRFAPVFGPAVVGGNGVFVEQARRGHLLCRRNGRGVGPRGTWSVSFVSSLLEAMALSLLARRSFLISPEFSLFHSAHFLRCHSRLQAFSPQVICRSFSRGSGLDQRLQMRHGRLRQLMAFFIVVFPPFQGQTTTLCQSRFVAPPFRTDSAGGVKEGGKRGGTPHRAGPIIGAGFRQTTDPVGPVLVAPRVHS